MLEKEMGLGQNMQIDQNRKRKGKEIVIVEENPSNGDDDLVNHQCDSVLAEIEEEQEEEEEKENETVIMGSHQQNSKLIKPCFVLTTDQRPRLRWTLELHTCFLNAVKKLGGPNKATPKAVKEIMGVDGLALHHVKSHLQKFRLGKCNVRNQPKKCTLAAECIAGTCASSRLPRSHVKMPRVARALRPKRPKEIQGSLYMLMEAQLHLRRCQEAQRMYLDLALGAQKAGPSSSPNYNIPQNFTALPPPPPPPPPQPLPPSEVGYGGYPGVQYTHQTMNPCDATIYRRSSYPPYNTLEAVKARLGSTTSQFLPATSETVAGAQATPAIKVTEMSGSSGVGAVSNEVSEDPVDAYMDWDKVEDEFPNDEFLLGFFDLFGFEGLV